MKRRTRSPRSAELPIARCRSLPRSCRSARSQPTATHDRPSDPLHRGAHPRRRFPADACAGRHDEGFSVVSQPVWAPDGKYILVRKQVGNLMTFYSAELWLVHRDGGSGIKVTESTKYANPTDASFTPDGRFIYFASWAGGGIFGTGTTIVRLDRQTGEFADAPMRPGVGPLVSPDGKTVAYVRRADAISELRLHDLATGAERILRPRVTTDDEENFIPLQGGFPRMAYTPDGKALVLTDGGKIHVVRLAGGTDRVVPFRAHVRQEGPHPVAVANRVPDGDVRAHFIRWASASPDGTKLAFSAVGKLYIMDLPTGTPRRLTTGPDREDAARLVRAG